MSSKNSQIQPWPVEFAALDCLKKSFTSKHFDDLLALR